MFKQFTDAATGKKIAVQYDHIFTLAESQNGGTQLISVGGATIQTAIPFKEISAWVESVDKELAADA